jgi:hypothetical protein
MIQNRVLTITILVLGLMFLTGCNSQETPQDKLFNLIFNVVIYTILTVMIVKWLLEFIDVELGKTGNLILASVAAIGYVVVSFLPGGFPLPGLN